MTALHPTIEAETRAGGCRAPWQLLLPRLPDGNGAVEVLGTEDAIRTSCQPVPQFTVLGAHGGSREDAYAAVVVNCGGKSPHPRALLSRLRAGGSVVWIGASMSVPSGHLLRASGFEKVRTYGKLGRVLVPESDGSLTRSGLSFYVPGRWRNRTAARLARLLSFIGCHRLMTCHKVVVARAPGDCGRGAYLLDWISSQIGQDICDAALFTSDSERGDRSTLQVLTARARVAGVAKVAFGSGREPELARETAALSSLSTTSLAGSIPKVLVTGSWQGCPVHIQAALPRDGFKYSTNLTPAHLRFLSALGGIDRRDATLRDWADLKSIRDKALEVGADADTIHAAIQDATRSIGLKKLPLHRIHGDFAPWNVLSRGGDIGVVDWEQSHAAGLPLYDAIYFGIRVATLIKRRWYSARQLLHQPIAILGIGEQVRTLAASLSLSERYQFTTEQIESLVRLCVACYIVRAKVSACAR